MHFTTRGNRGQSWLGCLTIWILQTGDRYSELEQDLAALKATWVQAHFSCSLPKDHSPQASGAATEGKAVGAVPSAPAPGKGAPGSGDPAQGDRPRLQTSSQPVGQSKVGETQAVEPNRHKKDCTPIWPFSAQLGIVPDGACACPPHGWKWDEARSMTQPVI